jgi:hypothetical protein
LRAASGLVVASGVRARPLLSGDAPLSIVLIAVATSSTWPNSSAAMNVDISPNRPPMSSLTAAAPAGSGSDGGGSSVAIRSKRRIIGRWTSQGSTRVLRG